MKKLFTTLFLLNFLWACKTDRSGLVNPSGFTDGSGSVHLLLGNPDNATNNPASSTKYLLIKEQYLTSYNNSLGRANWTAWHLGKSDLGSAVRQDDFRPDGTLPGGFRQIKPSEYTGSGFDRGHLCPSADRTSSQVNNSATFLMTNIIPQAPALNRGLWEEFEAFCREQVYNGNEIYIYSGSNGVGGSGTAGSMLTIAGGVLSVPAFLYKLVLVIPEGENDLSRINENTTVYAIYVPNQQSTEGKSWETYSMSVNYIESVTGLNFWSALSNSIASKLKQKRYTPPVVVTPPSSTTSTPTSATTTPTSTTTTPTSTTTPVSPASCGFHNGKKLYKGPEGGCYYINSNGNKTYVTRSECTC